MKVGDLVQLRTMTSPKVIAIVVGLSSDGDCEIIYFRNGKIQYTWIPCELAVRSAVR